MAKTAFSEKKTLSTSKLVVNLRMKVLHLEHSFMVLQVGHFGN